MERSNSSDLSNYWNIWEPVSAENITSHSVIASLLCPSLAVSLLRLFSFSFLTIPVGLALVRYFLLQVLPQCANAVAHSTLGAVNQYSWYP